MPWNPKRNRFWQRVLRTIAAVVAAVALKLAIEQQDPVGLILGGSLAAHLITTMKGRNRS